MTFLLLTVAGGLGAALRFLVDDEIGRRLESPMPLGTLAVNLLGSLVLGLITGLVTTHVLPAAVGVVVGTGFCGGFTTFSTASVGAARLWFAGDARIAVGYVLATVMGSVAAASAGLAVAVMI